MSAPRIWTVEARYRRADPWTIWTAWVDRATAEDEKQNAQDLGYLSRIRDARTVDREAGAL